MRWINVLRMMSCSILGLVTGSEPVWHVYQSCHVLFSCSIFKPWSVLPLKRAFEVIFGYIFLKPMKV